MGHEFQNGRSHNDWIQHVIAALPVQAGHRLITASRVGPLRKMRGQQARGQL